MGSVIQIFKNLAEDDEARQDVCNAIKDSSSCDCESLLSNDSACDGCAYKDHKSMQRAANILTNKLGG